LAVVDTTTTQLTLCFFFFLLPPRGRNTLAQNYRAKCLEVDVVGEEREKMGFDPSQQAEQMGALRSWGNPAAPTRS
jgi:hypothetical protein